MNILILGGTIFVGRALVEAALAGGHRLTLFHRGRSNPGLFPQVEHILGERDGDLAALAGRRWDAVIDTCGYLPRLVRSSARRLAGSVGQYTFISSISVYADTSTPGVNESAAVGRLADESMETINGESYGPLKALCEQAVEDELPGRALLLRPGLIVGPHDPSDRFTYWPVRVAAGGEVLAPSAPERVVQFIDVRDLAEWTLRRIEAGALGVYNVDGPAQPVAMGDLLECCRQVSGSDARLTWVDEAFLQENQVGEWIELPLWIPQSDPASAGFFHISIQKALDSGLTLRPLAETVQATLDWAATRPPDHAWRAGLKREREAGLLAAWQAHKR
jgi:2'-hydroxyisoflavone reductase